MQSMICGKSFFFTTNKVLGIVCKLNHTNFLWHVQIHVVRKHREQRATEESSLKHSDRAQSRLPAPPSSQHQEAAVNECHCGGSPAGGDAGEVCDGITVQPSAAAAGRTDPASVAASVPRLSSGVTVPAGPSTTQSLDLPKENIVRTSFLGNSKGTFVCLIAQSVERQTTVHGIKTSSKRSPGLRPFSARYIHVSLLAGMVSGRGSCHSQ